MPKRVPPWSAAVRSAVQGDFRSPLRRLFLGVSVLALTAAWLALYASAAKAAARSAAALPERPAVARRSSR